MKQLLGIGLAVLIVGGCMALVDSGDDEARDHEAQSACREFVERRLKSPGSADFGNESVTGSGGAFTVSGVVDSENSFGASVRNTYRCEVTSADGGDNWRLVDLEMTTN